MKRPIVKTFRCGPLLILCGAIAASAALLALLGQFSPVVEPDTASYQNLPLDSFSGAWGGYRTAGYPLLLRLGELVAPRGQAMPFIQFAMQVLAILVFFRGLRGWIVSEGLRAAVAGVLLFSNVLFRYNATLITDSPSSSLAILTVGLLLWIVREPKRTVLWLAFAISLFGAYQIRAVYVFMAPLLPLLGMAVWRLDTRPKENPRGRPLRFGAVLCALSLAPLLAFCTLRWSVVGDFGLVSFGGISMMGVAGQFLDNNLAAQLPSSVRPLAEAGLERQKQLAKTKPILAVGPVSHYRTMEDRYIDIVWNVYKPTAETLYGLDVVLRNRQSQRLALAILAKRPKAYAVWLLKAGRQGLRMMAIEFIGHPLHLLLLAALFAAWAWRLLFQQQNLAPGKEGVVAARNLLLLIAVSFALTKLLLVVLLSPPFGRYMDAGGVFFPTVLVAATWEQCSQRAWQCKSSAE